MNAVYLTDTDAYINESEYQRITALLPPWRQEEIFRMKNHSRQIQSAAVFALAQKAAELSGFLGEIKKNGNGKPYIEGCGYISFSHSGSLAAVAVSQSPVGIDIEKNRPRIPRAVKIFDSQIQKVIKTPDDFMKYWTMYEAHIKLGGAEFSKDNCFYHTFCEEDYTISVCSHNQCKFSLHYTLI